MPRKIVIDLPIRLFHWTLVVLVTAAWATAELGYLDRHMQIGQTILALLLWRVFWGLFGSKITRFSHFVASPSQVGHYLLGLLDRSKPMTMGYNPLGGWAILALLSALIIQASFGLFATDDVFVEGPLAHLVAKETQQWAAGVHELFFNTIVLGLISLHLAANIFYGLYRQHALLRRMTTGMQETNEAPTSPAPLWWAAALLIIAMAIVWSVTNYLYLTRNFS